MEETRLPPEETLMKVNHVKKALKAGEPVVGTIIHEARNPEIAHLLAAAGMDFILVDTEHSSPDLETMQDLTRGAKAAGLVPLARVTENEYFLISRTLDMGVMGLWFPGSIRARRRSGPWPVSSIPRREGGASACGP